MATSQKLALSLCGQILFFSPLRRLCVKWRRHLREGNVDTCCTNSHTLRRLSWCLVHSWKHTSYTILHTYVLKHSTYSSLLVIHQGCLVLVGTTLQSSFCKVSSSTSDWIWHWGIITGKPFEWTGRGKDKERDMRRQTPREKLERERKCHWGIGFLPVSM